jgi:hypothetical protein
MSRDDNDKPIENVLRYANPNPERSGCPARVDLISLAFRVRAADDPLWIHVAACSPCYTDVRELQREHGVSLEEEPGRVRWWFAAAAAALIVAGGSWYFVTLETSNVPAIVAQAAPSTVLDLRPFAVSRSEETATPAATLSLARKVQSVVLVLPVASMEGEYSLRILDTDLRPRLSTKAVAALLNGDTSITKDLNLADLPAGRYTLAIKREREDWRLFPLEIR